MKLKRITSLLIVIMILFGSSPSFAVSEGVKLYRLSGETRYDTAILVSKVTFASAEYAVIASGENFPDGLAGGILASALDGPLLLCGKDMIHDAVIEEMDRLGVQKVYILGGTDAISSTVENQLEQNFTMVERIGGSNRYHTAVLIADLMRNLGNTNLEYGGLANGDQFADALSAGGYLSNLKIPLLLTYQFDLPNVTKNFIDNHSISKMIVFGGEEVVAGNVLGQYIMRVTLKGDDRIGTSLRIAQVGFASPRYALLACSYDYPDALSSAPLADFVNGPILLSEKEQLTDDMINYILDSNIDTMIVIGGPESITDQALESIRKQDIPIEVIDMSVPVVSGQLLN